MIKIAKKLWARVFKKSIVFLHYGSHQWVSLEDARPDMTEAQVRDGNALLLKTFTDRPSTKHCLRIHEGQFQISRGFLKYLKDKEE